MIPPPEGSEISGFQANLGLGSRHERAGEKGVMRPRTTNQPHSNLLCTILIMWAPPGLRAAEQPPISKHPGRDGFLLADR
jgi:hypothetical protein